MDLVSIIVMEPGSDWPGHVHGSENVVTVGHHDEVGLVPRTREKLALFERQGQRVRVAVLSCNAATDVVATAGRAELAHALLRAVSGGHFGRLFLSAPDGAPLRLRSELVSLAGVLAAAARETSVCVRFVRATFGLPAPARPFAVGRSAC